MCVLLYLCYLCVFMCVFLCAYVCVCVRVCVRAFVCMEHVNCENSRNSGPTGLTGNA